jgi:hypothetical protein
LRIHLSTQIRKSMEGRAKSRPPVGSSRGGVGAGARVAVESTCRPVWVLVG